MELKTIQEMRQRAEGVLSDVHAEYRADLKFYWGDQWNGQEGARQLAGRQSVVFNNCPSLVHPVINAVKQAPPAIRILPLGRGATQEKAARLAAELAKARNLIGIALPHVQASAGAEHMLDGFRPRRRPIDDDVDAIRAALSHGAQNGRPT